MTYFGDWVPACVGKKVFGKKFPGINSLCWL